MYYFGGALQFADDDNDDDDDDNNDDDDNDTDDEPNGVQLCSLVFNYAVTLASEHYSLASVLRQVWYWSNLQAG